MERGGCVYIMATESNGTLYTGVTSQLVKRVYEHRSQLYPKSYTARYDCKKLVWYCYFDRIEEAIAQEKRIKGGSRAKKLKLIEDMNPQWYDLWNEIKDWI